MRQRRDGGNQRCNNQQCPERPRRRHAAESQDELAASHSITSSARPSSVIGKVNPSVFAVLTWTLLRSRFWVVNLLKRTDLDRPKKDRSPSFQACGVFTLPGPFSNTRSNCAADYFRS